ncbi:SYCE3 protein, partial [Thryothorus ludovicianus]|nr:SYCE3 protein [Thryothorus ludovicianus]
MAESESQEGNSDDRGKKVENFEMDMEELIEKIEDLTVRVSWLAFDNIALQTNPDLPRAMQHLEDAYLACKEQMEKQQEVLME